ncbi:RING-type E3 ubiquitin transferase [Hordeum vulgare]|nr:RING-type E3 ubiquitin transferase [Hordeum vulgare]
MCLLLETLASVIAHVITSPVKQVSGRRRQLTVVEVVYAMSGSQVPVSQIDDPSQVPAEPHQAQHHMPSSVAGGASDHIAMLTHQGVVPGTDSESGPQYAPHSEDSGEDSEVVELRKHARKFKKMRDTKS